MAIVYDEAGNEVGRVAADGTVYGKQGELAGSVVSNGSAAILRDNRGQPLAHVLNSGSVLDSAGKLLGRVGNEVSGGQVSNLANELVGTVAWGEVHYRLLERGGAALLLLLRGSE